ncbi:unnamed protein product [Blepharisma stoltei]|uniref:Protein kinase domain-containing protein n=1 Tax=Blepharisma stoltei TaxID=1481888 RepID=A0AAU9JXN9_9CILI|nr:unnamed protein product [Blepharisma stoltei]
MKIHNPMSSKPKIGNTVIYTRNQRTSLTPNLIENKLKTHREFTGKDLTNTLAKIATDRSNEKVPSRPLSSKKVTEPPYNIANIFATENNYLKKARSNSARPSIESPTKELNDLVDGDINDYIIGRALGQGAYAIVKQAVDKQTKMQVAIKSYDKSKLTQPHRRRNLRREIQIMQKLDHPHIVKLHKAIKSTRHIHLIQEYVGGCSLHSYVKSRLVRKLNEEEAKRIFKQCVSAVKYLHEMDISHRDIKLENILLDSSNNIKLIDFGFSCIMQKDQPSRSFCGTPSYMAPEIVKRKDFFGPPADIWALGVMLYVILTGTFPFRGTSDRDLFRKIVLGISEFPDSIPARAKILLKKMLSLNPSARPNISEIAEDQWLKEGKQENLDTTLKYVSKLCRSPSAER